MISSDSDVAVVHQSSIDNFTKTTARQLRIIDVINNNIYTELGPNHEDSICEALTLTIRIKIITAKQRELHDTKVRDVTHNWSQLFYNFPHGNTVKIQSHHFFLSTECRQNSPQEQSTMHQ